METSEELLRVLRERLDLSISISTEYECAGEFACISVTLDFIDDSGERHEVSRDYDSVCINRDR